MEEDELHSLRDTAALLEGQMLYLAQKVHRSIDSQERLIAVTEKVQSIIGDLQASIGGLISYSKKQNLVLKETQERLARIENLLHLS